MAFKPLHDRILLKPVAAETRTKGGLIIPDTAQEKPMRGKVVAVRDARTGERLSLCMTYPMAVLDPQERAQAIEILLQARAELSA